MLDDFPRRIDCTLSDHDWRLCQSDRTDNPITSCPSSRRLQVTWAYVSIKRDAVSEGGIQRA
jgi:hypothetical protein